VILRTRVGCALIALAAVAVVTAGATAAQSGGKPARGNPTPGTPQPDPPNPADRITLTGCVQMAPNASGSAIDKNTPNDTRFILIKAGRRGITPPVAGGSDAAASGSAPAYRLKAIESQLSPFVGAKVEISGEVEARTAGSRGQASGTSIPTIQVEFVQKIAAGCT
jgi:hypothetical protein